MLMHKLTKLRGESSRQLAHYFYCPMEASLGLLVPYKNSAKTPRSSLRASPVSLKAIYCSFSPI